MHLPLPLHFLAFPFTFSFVFASEIDKSRFKAAFKR